MEDFKVNDIVTIDSKENLIHAKGADKYGNPQTTIAWNHQGSMEHMYGVKGTITKIESDLNAVTLDILNPVQGVDYDWRLSLDMFKPSVEVPTATTKYRKFLSSLKTIPTDIQVWRALIKLLKQEKYPMLALPVLYDKYKNTELQLFKQYIEYTEVLVTEEDTKWAADVDHTLLENYYTKVPKELRILAIYEILNDYIDNSAQLFTSKASKKILEEREPLNYLHPYRRNLARHTEATLESIPNLWDKLEFKEKDLNIHSLADLKIKIVKTVIKVLNSTKAITLDKQIIKVEL